MIQIYQYVHSSVCTWNVTLEVQRSSQQPFFQMNGSCWIASLLLWLDAVPELSECVLEHNLHHQEDALHFHRPNASVVKKKCITISANEIRLYTIYLFNVLVYYAMPVNQNSINNLRSINNLWWLLTCTVITHQNILNDPLTFTTCICFVSATHLCPMNNTSTYLQTRHEHMI
jgi:hypothetical protein